jgi:hypothetical protein
MFFKTIVLACFIHDLSACVQFVDTRGPYPTFELCQARAYEIGNAIMEIDRGELRPVTFECKLLTGTQL